MAKSISLDKVTQFLNRIRKRPKKQVRDIVFRLVFGEDKEALLQLYNLMNGTDYSDVSDLQIVTLESAIYVTWKNDVAFVFSGTINLYEHQSTINPNMPLRFLIYLAKEYQSYIDNSPKSIYGESLIKLPTPKFVVFYNGVKDWSGDKILRLSDAFSNTDVEGDIDVTVKVVDIKYDPDNIIVNGCEKLRQYSLFVKAVNDFRSIYDSPEDAINAAIDYCIENGVLEDILRKHRSEILGSFLEEFDKEKYENTLKADAEEKARNELLITLVKEGALDLDVAVSKAGVDKEEFESWLNK